MTELNRLNRKAVEIRKSLLEMIYEAGTGHTGSSLSNTDILVALYYGVMKIDPNNPNWEERDRYIQSKGHAVESYWAVLADKGFFPKEELKTFSKYNSRLIGHPNNKVPGVEMNTGALGHGLSVSVGMALSAKMDKKTIRVFTLMGDGELAEGSVWEAAMSAAQYKLDNLIGIIDRNRLQISGTTDDVMSNEPLDKKWESFGWHVIQVDGNDVGELVRVFNEALQITGKPTIILANTVKGKGISIAENVESWHHHVPTKEEYKIAMQELSERLEELA
ncbi:transketolase [Halalkalibacter sp. APA_J-10(15)]|uniref:transketolase n=1 Tax=Halalkalibacter sp. APA_J-10(15) TaxID=2933805 RepID=UPI001FF5EA57|nr:transketolase [Halalkalibacter sp. APA_J-10(15)]MCK0473372.1 transketolase [Halalkalibacter sp. APA_J-10(15)]